MSPVQTHRFTSRTLRLTSCVLWVAMCFWTLMHAAHVHVESGKPGHHASLDCSVCKALPDAIDPPALSTAIAPLDSTPLNHAVPVAVRCTRTHVPYQSRAPPLAG